jgi:NAD(P)-dependent dehydrogenase (short-subunit alcohol dehydrogenase family)
VIGIDLHDADIIGDVTDEATWQRVPNRLDALVNNAGTNVRGTVEEIDLATWNRIMSVNLTAAFLGAKHCMPLLRQSKGAIVNVASGAGLVGVRRGPAYAASKGGVIALTRQLAIDYAGEGVRVNAVCPGPVDTPLLRRLANTHGELEAMAASQPLGRLGSADEVANAIYFLASEQASFMTGAIVPVDGGYTAR